MSLRDAILYLTLTIQPDRNPSFAAREHFGAAMIL